MKKYKTEKASIRIVKKDGTKPTYYWIDGVRVVGGKKKLNVVIPAGMSGEQLSEWRNRNKKETIKF